MYANIKQTNDCSANLLHSYLFWGSCELLLASYGLKLSPKNRQLLGFLFNYSGHRTCSQATPWLLNTWSYMTKQKFDYTVVLWMYLAMKTIQRNRRRRCASRYLLSLLNLIAPVSEVYVRSYEYSNHLDINSVAGTCCVCVCVWLKLECAFSMRSFLVLKRSSLEWNVFVPSGKSACPQHEMC